MNRNLRLLGIGAGLRMMGNALYFPFLALFLVNVLHVSFVDIGIIITGVGLVQLPFMLLGGMIADRVERLHLILFGLVAEVVTTFGMAYAFSIESLVLAVAAALIGGSLGNLAAPAFSAYIADFAEGPERTRGFTFYRIGFNAGYSAGVMVGGLLIASVGFAGAVAVAGVIIAGGTAFLALLLEPSPRDLARRAGASLESPTPGEAPSPRSIPQSLALLRKDKVALELLFAFLLASLVAGQWSVTFPLYVQTVLGVPYSLLGIGLALNGLVVVFGQSPTTESVIGRRHTSIAIWGVAFYTIAFVGLGIVGLWGTLPVAAFFVSVVVLTVGENLLTIPQTTLPSNVAPKDEIGSYNGAFSTVGGIGYVVSVLIGGVTLSVTSNPLLIWLILVVPAIPAVLLLRHASRRLVVDVDRA